MNELATVLIVDDLKENRIALEAALATPDLEIVLADSGTAALRVLLDRSCAVVLLDVAMPGMDGFETAHMIHAREKTRRVPIIFVTAHLAQGEAVFRGYAEGAVDYLIKPVDVHALRAKVSVFVELWRQQRETQRTAEALHAAEHRERKFAESLYDVTFEDAPIGIGHADVNGRWLRVNARLAAMLGRSLDEVRASSLVDMVYEEDRAALEEHLRAVVAGEERHHKGEYRLKMRDGSVVWTSLTYSLIRDLDGRPLQLAIVEDISEEKRLALALEASERRFARLRESGLLGIFHERPDGVTESANDAFLAMVGWTQEDVGKHKLRSAIFTNDAADVGETRAHELLRSTGVCPAFEHEFVRRDGRRGVMFVGGVANGGAIGFAVDVTAIREAERSRLRTLRELEDALRAREDFLTLASHELRTPLTPLSLVVGSLKSTLSTATAPVDSGWLARQVEAIDRYVRRSEALVTSLLEVSELSVGKIVLEREDTELVALVQGVLERHARELARAGRVATIEGAAPVVGSWDRLHIEHIVENLLSNAIKHAPYGPIEISIRGDEAEARLTVCDHGPGVDRELQAKIFDRFARLAAIQHHGGFGLGLWAARELARAHGGTLEIESVPGSGACFHLVLPLGGKPKE